MLRSRRLALAFLTLGALALAGCPGGNNPPGDGGPPNDTNMPGNDVGPHDGGPGNDAGTMMMSPVTICPGDATPPLASGAVCEVTGSGPGLLIQADILSPHEVFRGGQVFVDGTGTIQCVGCDCSATAGAAAATHVTCPDGVVSPGLINAHEHITYQGQPYVGNITSGERYEHRHEWRRGQDGHTELTTPGMAPVTAMQWAELRMVMGGATSINGSGTSAGFLRNLDKANDAMEGLGQERVYYDPFPLDDSSGTMITSGCAYAGSRRTAADIAASDSYTPHISEGINAAARNEFLCQSMMGDTHDIIADQTALIHGVALLPIDMQTIALDGAMLIWSPRSNVTLYGDTARVVEYDRMGVPIAMGTDWIYSGSMNMLRELQCADELNATYYGHYFSDESLWRMATINGAIATATDDVIGSIAVGRVADLAIFDGAMHVDHRAVIDAAATDVALVLRGGVPLYGEDAVIAALPNGGTGCDTIDVCGEARRACVMRETGMTLSGLMGANGSAYPLFFCADPTNEPSCRPERDGTGSGYPSPMINGSSIYSGMASATDADGDGIADAADNCPMVFNPIRPLDMGMQADGDGDGLGDSCDPCPLDAASTSCGTANPNDRDRDTIDDSIDNCPTIANTDQADTDSDGHGDACDACPSVANPGTSACPATIYQVQMGTVASGQMAAVHGVVTAVGSTGFFLQTETSDPAYTVPDYSGVFVFTGGAPTIARGDAVTVSGTVSTYMNEVQIGSSPTVMRTGAGSIPAPVDVTAAEIGTGGTRARALEGVLATVLNVSVTNTMPALGMGDRAPSNEFEVAGALRVDDQLYLLTPLPAMGESFGSITGIVAQRYGNSRLLPRDAADVVGGTPVLAGLDPSLSYAYVGDVDAMTIPTPLTVRISRASPTPIAVTLSSSSPTSLAVPPTVTIPAGQTSAPVLVTGVMMASAVTITATLGGSLMADVRVLGAAEVPASFTLSPSMATVMVSGTQRFTVTLDIPAPASGQALTIADTTGGTVPTTVTVPAGQTSATFDYVAPAAAASGTLTVSGVGTPQTADVMVTMGSPGHLVINEVDYDQTGSAADSREFVEIYNSSSAPISLTGIQLVLVNGGTAAMSSYTTVDLAPAGMLLPHEYLVVGSATLLGTITADHEITLTPATNAIQNGPTDGVALFDSASMRVLDALSYEGSVTNAAIGTGHFSLVEGTALPASVADSNMVEGSLCRLPNGTDTDNAATDWAFSPIITPGDDNRAM
ncbi:MAG: amidohydrolase family protein [Sandaracinus sp.]